MKAVVVLWLVVLALGYSVSAMEFGEGLNFESGSYNYTLGTTVTADNMSFNDNGISFGTYGLVLTPSSHSVYVVIEELSPNLMNFTETPTFLINVEHNITGFNASQVVNVTEDGVYDGNTTSDANGFFSYVCGTFNSETVWAFGGGGSAPTTTTTTTSTSTTSTTGSTTTTTAYSTNIAMSPCLEALSEADLKEMMECVYVGNDFQRDDGVPTMGHWFYLLIFGGFTFVAWLKTRKIEVAGGLMLILLVAFNGQFPPQAALVYWGLVVASVTSVLYGLYIGLKHD